MTDVSEGQIPEWELPDRLVKSRKSAKVSQHQMAEHLGITRQAISRYEKGTTVPKLAILRVWALRCGVPLRWLQYGDIQPRPDVVAQTPWRGPLAPSTGWLTALEPLAPAA